jgi:hypothetical protein
MAGRGEKVKDVCLVILLYLLCVPTRIIFRKELREENGNGDLPML